MEGAAKPPSIPSLPVRVGQVFFSPGKLFEALRENPAWFGVLLLTGLLVSGSVLLLPADVMVEAAREQLISQGREVPPGGLETMGTLFRVIGAVGAVLGIFIWAFLLAGIMTLVFNFLFGGEGRYKQYLSVVSHGFLIGAVGALLTLPLKIAQGDPQLTLSLGTFAFFLEEGYAFRVLRLLDLFGLWGYTVMAIGVTKIDPKRSLGFALAFFYAFALVFALIFGIFGGQG
jgi:hypothetical protein